VQLAEPVPFNRFGLLHSTGGMQPDNWRADMPRRLWIE
jgi:hypothetical protein